MPHLLRKTLQVAFGAVFAGFLLFVGATTTQAASCNGNICISQSLSRSTIYPGDSYSVIATVSNSGPSAYSGSVDMYWGYTSTPQNGFCSGSYTAPAGGSATVSCSSTGDTAGTTVYFQANTTANGTVIWSTTSYTVATRPVASVSISGSSPISYNGGSYLSVTPTNAHSCSVSGGGNWVFVDGETKWWTGNLTSNTTFTATCTANSGATGTPTNSFTVVVNPPPKTNPIITWADFSMTYGGSITPATANVAGSFSYSTASYDAGTRSITATFTPMDTARYNTVTLTVSMTVNKKPLTVQANNASKTYGQVNPSFSASYSGFVSGDSTSSLGGTLGFTTSAGQWSNAGTYSVTPSGLSSNNYSFSFYSGTFTINKATPSLSWSDPAAITYGIALSGIQLNATANVVGMFVYSLSSGSPAAGAVLPANETDSQGLRVAFTPTDTTNYNSASKTVYIFVNKASQTISFGVLGNRTTTETPFSVSASASSGLGVSFSAPVTTPANQCSVSGSTVTINRVGTCTIRASQSGNSNYNAAANVNQSFTVSPASRTLTVTAPTNGTITATGINCGNDCTESYTSGTSVTLTATPASGYSFSSWGGACSGQGNPCSLKMDANKTVSASFVLSTNTLGVVTKLDGNAYGSVTVTQVSGAPSPNMLGGVTSNANPSFYTRDTIANVNAVLRAPPLIGNNLFSSWTGCDVTSGSYGNDCTILLSGGQNKTITANYVSPAMQPNFSVNDIQIRGGKYDGTSYYLEDTAGLFLVSVSNSGWDAPDPYISISYTNGTEGYTDGKNVGRDLATGASANVDFDYGHLPPGSMTVTACITPGVITERCLSRSFLVGPPPQPSPALTCQALFTNTINDLSSYWTINTNVNIQGCPTSRYSGLWVNTSSDVSVNTTLSSGVFNLIIDLTTGGTRAWTATDCQRMATVSAWRVI